MLHNASHLKYHFLKYPVSGNHHIKINLRHNKKYHQFELNSQLASMLRPFFLLNHCE